MSDPFEDVRSESMQTRREAETAIATMIAADHSILPTVLENIRTGDVNSRWYLARSIMRCGPSIIPELITQIKHETDSSILKYSGAVLATFGEPAVDQLIKLFSSDNAKLRGMAAAALERIGGPAVDALVRASESDDEITRQCASFVIQKLGGDTN